MVNESEIISIDEFRDAAENNYRGFTTVDWHGIKLEIKRHLSLIEVWSFVDLVHKAAFTADGVYMPERVDAAIQACTVELYTNINLGDDPLEAYDLIYHSCIYEVIAGQIDHVQYDRIIKAAIKKIENTANASIQAATKQVAELSATLEGMEANLASLVDSVEPGELQGMIHALSSGVIDEGKLVKAITDIK